MVSSSDEYEVALIENETDARLCAKLIAEEFAASNPFRVFLQSTSERLYDTWLWPQITGSLDQNLSFLVRHCPTNEIIAAIIASDLFLFHGKHQHNTSSPTPNNPVADFFNEMHDRFIHHDFDQELKPNMVLYIKAGATRAEHSDKGIATQLRTHLLNYARDIKGFEYAYVQTAHPATRHIYIKKMNGQEMTIIDPATWLWKNEGNGLSRPYQGYKGEPIVNVLVRLK